MEIITYNVNGIRAAARKGLADWLAAHSFDIVCLQEAKADQDQVDMAEFEALGYHHYWHSAQKKGYSGVVTLSRREPDLVVAGMGHEAYDNEGRVLRTDFGDWTLLNCYFPSGTTGDARQAFKMDFLADFEVWVNELKKQRPHLIIVGDYNIAHQEIDIHDPVRNKQTSGFLPEERDWMTKWFNSGFADAFRKVQPQTVEYSWWTYRANARANNKGWRIDYQSVSDSIADRIRAAHHRPDAAHSDHCPVWMEIDL
ncbi:MAG: exodeoxyribonuclease III [Saprospiraceae bacterium]